MKTLPWLTFRPVWAGMALVLSVALVPAQTGSGQAAPSLKLNGITSILGDRQALLTAQWAGRESAFILSEGEESNGIKLLAVDFKVGTVTVCNQGTVQKITLHQAVSKIAASTADDRTLVADGGGPGAERGALSGNTGEVSGAIRWSGDVSGGGGLRSKASSNTADETGGGADQSTEPGLDKAPDPWWLIGSKNLEQARLDTADQVRSGEREPYPLTPLTPPGTPAELIGSGRLYFVAGN